MQTKKITSVTEISDYETFTKHEKLKQLRMVKSKLSELKEIEKELQALLMDEFERDGEELYIAEGIKAMIVTQAGSINWQKIPEVQQLDNAYLDSFRKEDKHFWRFRAV